MGKKKNKTKHQPKPRNTFDPTDESARDLIKEQLGLPPEEKKIEKKHSESQGTQGNRNQQRSSRNDNSTVRLTGLINLPKAAREIFESKNKPLVENLYLLHHRFSEWKWVGGKEKPQSFLKPLKKQTSPFELNKRVEDFVKSYDYVNYVNICYEPLDKLAIGVGGASPYDSTLLMALHPLYGTPYLPATAIKGMLRSYWEQEVFGGLVDENKEVLKKLFGDTESSGNLVFFDIFPQKFDIDFDVMTPHYQGYYQKGEDPTDDQNPVLITFPIVKNAQFHVYVACREDCLLERYEVEGRLKEAFKYYGIGAKTALGYGLSK